MMYRDRNRSGRCEGMEARSGRFGLCGSGLDNIWRCAPCSSVRAVAPPTMRQRACDKLWGCGALRQAVKTRALHIRNDLSTCRTVCLANHGLTQICVPLSSVRATQQIFPTDVVNVRSISIYVRRHAQALCVRAQPLSEVGSAHARSCRPKKYDIGTNSHCGSPEGHGRRRPRPQKATDAGDAWKRRWYPLSCVVHISSAAARLPRAMRRSDRQFYSAGGGCHCLGFASRCTSWAAV